MQVIPLVAAAVLAFLVGTQIAFIHHLGRLGLTVSILIVWLILMASDRAIFRPRFGLGARLGFMALLFVVIWALNSASSLTSCSRHHTNCHRVFGF